MPPRLAQLFDQKDVGRMADAGEIGRMLGFGIDADRPPQFLGPPLGEVDDLGQRRHLILAVVGRITGAQLRQALLRAERL
ncbi:hypothetical protein WR25_09408 [Diploscapter pachys]|uniref:Uncharacterized protein n=1 Tax=Diploscapter pachys TaxID=2018661 RepID=A0A2A2M6V8_9BILA|nr:hypothetical protein WR25_09408 [Diploscapter pachys]